MLNVYWNAARTLIEKKITKEINGSGMAGEFIGEKKVDDLQKIM